MTFNRYRLGEVCSFIDYRGKTPRKTTSGIPLITAKIVKNGFIGKPDEFIAEEDYDSWMRRGIPRKGSVILTTEAPLGEVARIPSDDRFAFAQRIIVLEPMQEILDAGYLYYALLDSILMDRIKSRATGTTVTGIKAAELKKVEIDCPPIETQKRVASLLSSLDQRIENNESINDNLLQQAQALYASIFYTNADPNWPSGHLADLITVKYGKDHKKLADGSIPVFGSGGIMRYVERPLYTQESVLIPRKGTLNNVMYVNEPFWSVDTMFYSEMKQANVAKFVYHFLRSKDLASMNAGSAVPSMTTDILNAMELVIPPDDVLAGFEGIVAPMYAMMQANERESSKLAQLRDTLLPRLMSGEIDVSSITI